MTFNLGIVILKYYPSNTLVTFICIYNLNILATPGTLSRVLSMLALENESIKVIDGHDCSY